MRSSIVRRLLERHAKSDHWTVVTTVQTGAKPRIIGELCEYGSKLTVRMPVDATLEEAEALVKRATEQFHEEMSERIARQERAEQERGSW